MTPDQSSAVRPEPVEGPVVRQAGPEQSRRAHHERNLGYKDERWFKLLLQAVDETSVTTVAARLSAGYDRPYSRAAISQIIHGLYIARPDKIAERVMKLFDRWPCPYLNTDISGEDCRDTRSGPTPSHNPAALAHRRMCKTCQHKGGKQ